MPFWRDVRVLAILSQLAVLAAVLLAVGFLLETLATRMTEKGFFPDLGFLDLRAGFEIAERTIPYDPGDSFAQALLVGLVNTLMVSVVGIVLATLLGLVVGIARLSRNWLVNRLALAYVELFRNTPLLLQLLVIYFVVFLQMPPVRDSYGAARCGLPQPARPLRAPPHRRAGRHAVARPRHHLGRRGRRDLDGGRAP